MFIDISVMDFGQVIACHLSSAKPLPEQMLNYSKLEPLEQTLGKS